ncbi:transcription factor IIA [Pestalotiopsis sp. NC0098]|nr:transcription factor IIA [Pestalotiopsis sp. NC0098]
MSNSQVGTIYQQIIDDVLDTSRVDLEENGVDESILEELKLGWQKKLSAQNLATFPWDPKPDPPAPAPAAAAPQQPPAAPAPTHQDVNVSNGVGMPQQGALPGAPAYAHPSNGMKNDPGIKTEPGLEPVGMPQHFSNPEVRDRLINNLQTQYGSRADATINKLQESIGSAAPNRPQYSVPPRPAGQAVPQQARPNPMGNVAQQQYQQQMAAGNLQQGVPQQPVQNGNAQKPAPSQFDGTAEEGVLIHQNAAGQTTELGRVEIDRMLHAQLEARAKAMEGGGMMVPLKRATKSSGVSYHRAQPTSGPARFDGGDDDIKSEEDEDAINSDLDDSDDNAEDDDDDDDGGQIMLCMYDKVQRVKNKWKCVLKDGVLSVNGKDYVFHKASGEYEW